MNFKDLAIDFDKIKVLLGEFADSPPREEIKGGSYHYIFQKNKSNCLLIVHKKNKGTVTLQPAGQNQNLAIAAAQFVLDNANVVEQKSISLTVDGYTEDKLLILFEYLKEMCGGGVPNGLEKKGVARVGRVVGKQGDSLTFSLYDTGRLLIQGRPVVLAMGLLHYLAEDGAVSQSDLFTHLASSYNVDSSLEQVIQQLTKDYPYAYDYAGENLRSLMAAAIGMRSITVDLPEYSPISFSALRALESFMKKAVLMACDEDWREFSQVFDRIQQSPPRYVLREAVRERIGCTDTCSLLEGCYPYYVSQRHGTFHASGLDADIKVILSKADAVVVVDNSLGLINNYSKVLLRK